MKKINEFKAIIGACLLLVMLISCMTGCSVKAESIMLSESETTMKIGETKTLFSTVLPQDTTDKTVEWSSSNVTVVSVNNMGIITAISSGTCVITAKCGDVSTTMLVTVKEKGPDFKELYNELDSDVKYGWKLGSDGSYLSADTNVYDLDDYTNASILYSIKDMNSELGLPDSLYQDMIGTNSLMGKQQEIFEDIGIKVTWSYHPDNGLEVSYKLLNP